LNSSGFRLTPESAPKVPVYSPLKAFAILAKLASANGGIENILNWIPASAGMTRGKEVACKKLHY
jgi:hypothetical protein